MLGFALAVMAVAYLDRVCISTAAPAIKDDLGLDDAQMGYVFSAFTLAYALFEVPSGWLADRFITPAPLGLVIGLFAGAGFSIFVAVRTAARTTRESAKAGPLPSVPDDED